MGCIHTNNKRRITIRVMEQNHYIARSKQPVRCVRELEAIRHLPRSRWKELTVKEKKYHIMYLCHRAK